MIEPPKNASRETAPETSAGVPPPAANGVELRLNRDEIMLLMACVRSFRLNFKGVPSITLDVIQEGLDRIALEVVRGERAAIYLAPSPPPAAAKCEFCDGTGIEEIETSGPQGTMTGRCRYCATPPTDAEIPKEGPKGHHYGKPLSVEVVEGELRISIGVQTLAHAVTYADWANPYDEKRKDYIRTFAITDAEAFARDVMYAMLAEKEDGSSPLSDFIDAATEVAVDDGSMACEYEQQIKHGENAACETWAMVNEVELVSPPLPPQREQKIPWWPVSGAN